MLRVSNDPKEVAETAMKYEEDGRRILVDASEKAQDPLSKATFKFLADQEVRHMEAIKAFAESLATMGRFDPGLLGDPVTLQQAGGAIKGLFAQFKSEFEETAGKEDERLEVYRVAMDMERYGHDFYEKAAEQAADYAARKLYDFLAGEEIRHFQIIQDTRDFLKQPDAFMAIEEHWMTT